MEVDRSRRAVVLDPEVRLPLAGHGAHHAHHFLGQKAQMERSSAVECAEPSDGLRLGQRFVKARPFVCHVNHV